MYNRLVKRFFDILSSGLGILVLSPVLALLAILIKTDSPGPVFFKQKRVGKGKKHFMIYKFRTMRTDAPHDTPTDQLSDPMRYITRTGKFLRKTSLDELPQLFNIFKGEMSVIGPRPQYLCKGKDPRGMDFGVRNRVLSVRELRRHRWRIAESRVLFS